MKQEREGNWYHPGLIHSFKLLTCMKGREKYFPNETGKKVNGFFTYSGKNTQRLILAN